MAAALHPDAVVVLEHRHDQGGDSWSTPDGKIGVGDPFSTLAALITLHELRVPKSHEAVRGGLDRVLARIRPDGRIAVAPKGTVYPCHTAYAARVLARFGYARSAVLRPVHQQLLEERHQDGGWRCRRKPIGASPETDASNPGVTLHALDAFRFRPDHEQLGLESAVETLLAHWQSRLPLGPCHFGIGSRFQKVEFPFFRYNLFSYVYVLSHYARARDDRRFREAFEQLAAKRDARGRMVVEAPNRKLAKLELCRAGEPSKAATRRFREIERRLAD